ncbi:hypothetical protein EGR_10646 [Echinococcus granulosus]|uniref:Uncharacterized protein n=1 Tax=Echinococcus granulosus TaxID=6210 RepID=W6U079_ECHGR|nr:hypothetical protein EGR_10646 [Echinococcus granulosus]EUB54495.1 hypothetical protein EGR_10646 [Echinococcus granulosus]
MNWKRLYTGDSCLTNIATIQQQANQKERFRPTFCAE